MTITIIANAATAAGLIDSGPVAKPLGEPVCHTRTHEVELEGAGGDSTGLWECSPGRFERQLENAEVMHILAGSCTFTPEQGEAREIRAGDTLFFPRNTKGVWEIHETLRKVYVLMG